MGFGGISIWQLLILLVIVVMVFGTKRLRNMGGDLGTAIKGFRSSMRDGNDSDKGKEDDKDKDKEPDAAPEVLENRSAEDDDSAEPRQREASKETSKETGS